MKCIYINNVAFFCPCEKDVICSKENDTKVFSDSFVYVTHIPSGKLRGTAVASKYRNTCSP